jgi:hypothetical protein
VLKITRLTAVYYEKDQVYTWLLRSSLAVYQKGKPKRKQDRKNKHMSNKHLQERLSHRRGPCCKRNDVITEHIIKLIQKFKRIMTRLKVDCHCSRFARAGGAFIVFEARHARVSRFSKPAPPARAKRLQWKIAFTQLSL